MTTPYLYTRRTDPRTGVLVYTTGTTFARSDTPALEIVARYLRTPLGECKADPERGIAWQRVDKLGATARADALAVLRDGLRPLVADGIIANLSVEVDAASVALACLVGFVDPRSPDRLPQSIGVVVP